jgi:hypothetical protein
MMAKRQLKGGLKMKKSVAWSKLLLLVAVIIFSCIHVYAQSGFEDDRVMLQGFYWESHYHGYPDKFPQWNMDTKQLIYLPH